MDLLVLILVGALGTVLGAVIWHYLKPRMPSNPVRSTHLGVSRWSDRLRSWWRRKRETPEQREAREFWERVNNPDVWDPPDLDD